MGAAASTKAQQRSTAAAAAAAVAMASMSSTEAVAISYAEANKADMHSAIVAAVHAAMQNKPADLIGFLADHLKAQSLRGRGLAALKSTRSHCGDDDVPSTVHHYVRDGIVESHESDEEEGEEELEQEPAAEEQGKEQEPPAAEPQGAGEAAQQFDVSDETESDGAVVWHLQVYPDSFSDARHCVDLESGELKPRRPRPHTKAASFFGALREVDGRWLWLGTALNGWPGIHPNPNPSPSPSPSPSPNPSSQPHPNQDGQGSTAPSSYGLSRAASRCSRECARRECSHRSLQRLLH